MSAKLETLKTPENAQKTLEYNFQVNVTFNWFFVSDFTSRCLRSIHALVVTRVYHYPRALASRFSGGE